MNQKEKIIKEKIKFIEKTTGNKIVIEENNSINADILIDFPDWCSRNMVGLPKILYKSFLEDKVHILHELIHLEKFFTEQYPLIVCKNSSFHGLTDVFKNLPEDYITHKIIKHEYRFNPIDKRWFGGKDNLGFSDEQIAANLVNFHAFYEFCPEYGKDLQSFVKNCKRQKHRAFLLADRTIKSLKKMDYKGKDGYNQCLEEIIQIFVPTDYQQGNIYTRYLSQGRYAWSWTPYVASK